jgi:hypothetical protein
MDFLKISSREAGSCLLLFFLSGFAQVFSASLPPDFYDKTRYFQEAEKVYFGVVSEVSEVIKREHIWKAEYYLNLTVEVYLAWKGNVSEFENVVWYTSTLLWMQPFPKKGTTVMMFTKPWLLDLFSAEDYSQVGLGSFFEFENGSGCVNSLLELSEPVILASYETASFFELRLSNDWLYAQAVGTVFSYGNDWYISEKLGPFYANEIMLGTNLIYQVDLGWIWFWGNRNRWFFRFETSEWMYIYPNNHSDFSLLVYSTKQKKWMPINAYYFSRVGFMY